MYKLLALLTTGLVVACTPSETACNLMFSAKKVFDVEVNAGTVDVRYVPNANAAFNVGKAVCEAPAGTYDQAKIMDVATDAYIAIRNATRNNAAAYSAMKPHLENFERYLNVKD